MDIQTNEEALRLIAQTIRKNNEAQLSLLENYSMRVSSVESDWDDSTYRALREAVELQYAKIKQLIAQTRDFPPYLDKLADVIKENKMFGNGGVL